MTNNERIIRDAYQTAEMKDMAAWVASFTSDGIFVDESLGITYRGPDLARRLDVWQGMPHGFIGSIGQTQAAASALSAIGEFLSSQLARRADP